MDTDFFQKFSLYRILEEEEKMDSKNQNITIYNDYPAISDKLIECLQKTFPDKLPKKELSTFEYGKLVGQQEVIDKLKFEKDKNENN